MIHNWLFEWSRWGWPLVASHLYQSTIFALLVVALALAARRLPARVRYLLLLAASGKFLMPALVCESLFQRLGATELLSQLPARDAQLLLTETITAPAERIFTTSPQSVAVHNELYCLATLVWASVCLLALGLWLKRYRDFARIISGGVAGDDRVDSLIAEVCARIGLRARVRVAISPLLTAPGVFHVLRPVLALPAGLTARLSDTELETIVTHEMLHIKRRDNLLSNIHMVLCCGLWFHPLLWIIDRLLIKERERACDERVIELGSEPHIYASSMVKVARLCLGWKIAGFSAANTNLKERIELIMNSNRSIAVSWRHRLLVGTALLAALLFTTVAGLPRVSATQDTTPRPTTGRSEQPEAVAPEPHGARTSADMKALITQAEAVPASPIKFQNRPGAPLVITQAQARRINADNNNQLITMPVITVTNTTDRPITAVKLKLEHSYTRDVTTHRVNIAPGQSYELRLSARQWASIVPAMAADELTVSVAEATIAEAPVAPADVLTVDVRPLSVTPALAAPQAQPPADLEQVQAPPSADKYIPAQYRNPEGAPLVIVEAKVARRGVLSYLPIVKLVNRSTQRITQVKLRFKPDGNIHAVTSLELNIDPGAIYVFTMQSIKFENVRNMRVQVLGVQFEDGSVWGSLTSEIDSNDLWID